MNNRLIIFSLCFIVSITFAQKNVDSPYSYYGFGEFRSQTTEENRLMGGVEMYSDSIHLNFRNPAMYGDLKYTTFAVGATLSRGKLNTDDSEVKVQNSTLDYIALGFPINRKIGVGVALVPYSSVGYKIMESNMMGGVEVNNQYEGKGGVNRASLSVGYEIFRGLNVGGTLYMNFGKIERQNLHVEQGVQLVTSEFSKSSLKGVNYRLGVSYKREISDKLTFMSSIDYTPQAKIFSNNERILSTLEFSSKIGRLTPREVRNIDLSKNGLQRTELIIPDELSFGMGLGEDKKWFVGVNYIHIGMKKFENLFVPQSNVEYENMNRFSLGGFFIPKYDSFTDYWKRITYRFGIRYENMGIVLKKQTITDFGTSFGLSLPLKGFSSVTIGLEYGQRGTTNHDLIKQNYYNLRIGLSLNDKWFQRSKY